METESRTGETENEKPDGKKKGPAPELLEKADEVVQISDGYCKYVYRKRNCWMVDRSSRLIACYNGAPGGTLETILYAEKNGLEVIRYGC